MVVATFFIFFFHEMSHWIAYEILGYDAGFTLNGASVKDASIALPTSHRMIASAAGPVFTIIQAIVCFFILKKHQHVFIYPFLFMPFLMRLGAGWANRFEPNDEGRISLEMGLNLYVVSAVVVGFLFFLVFKTSRRNTYSVLVNIITSVVGILLLFAVAYLDVKHKIRFV